MYDVIVVGGGPAGMTAALYALRKRLDVLVISQDLGGKINYQLELPYQDTCEVIRGSDVVEQFWQELDRLAYARRLERVVSVQRREDVFTVTTEASMDFAGRSVILATGARIKQLGVPGERDYMGRGLSYSAISHASLFVNKEVTVVGQGELALRAAAELAQLATVVNLVLPAGVALDTPLGRKLDRSMKAVIWEGHQVKAIQGNGYANRLLLKAPDGRLITLPSDGIFVEMGLIPNSEPVRGLAELDAGGYVIVDNRNRTNCPGLFAAGDVTNVCTEQVLVAVGDGAKAALSAFDYLLSCL
ncbi:MAG: hypothetical protein Fur0021_12340 [Candidatus Promineifilaceae bacterium]